MRSLRPFLHLHLPEEALRINPKSLRTPGADLPARDKARKASEGPSEERFR